VSTVRVVHDNVPGIDPAVVLPELCRKPIGRDHLCFLRRGHRGNCLPAPWPRGGAK
jgi:hypothetical protein